MKKIAILVFLGLSSTATLYAQNVTVIGTKSVILPIASSSKNLRNSPAKKVTLLKMDLSSAAKQSLLNRIEQYERSDTMSVEKKGLLPDQVELGMNNLPVLDQGPHGSCVTFAVTAALDAAINGCDFVSQLCLLELGTYLGNYSYIKSGWNGTNGEDILSRIKTFGIVNKSDQTKYSSCGGLKDYPVIYFNEGNPMSVKNYHNMSQDIVSQKIKWKTIFSLFLDEFENSSAPYNDMNRVVNEIKYALAIIAFL